MNICCIEDFDEISGLDTEQYPGRAIGQTGCSPAAGALSPQLCRFLGMATAQSRDDQAMAAPRMAIWVGGAGTPWRGETGPQ